MADYHSTCDLSGIREAVCIHTRKITDSCRDKDCIEQLRVYLTRESQQLLDHSASARARSVELIHTDIHTEAVPYNNGYYTLELTFFYRVVADVNVGSCRPTPIYGLAVFSKRALLYGGDCSAKVFSSRMCHCTPADAGPHAVAEVVDPMILDSAVVDSCSCCGCGPDLPELPPCVLQWFDDELVLSGECRRLLITIGQFSILRLERDTQLLIPAFDYCIPNKSCSDGASGGGCGGESPCDLFGKLEFPVEAFCPGRPPAPADSGCSCGKQK